MAPGSAAVPDTAGAGGKVEIDHYIAGRKGQGALKLVRP